MEAEREPVPPVLVLGLGNPLLADDGLGLELLEALRGAFEGDERVELVDGGTQGLALLGRLAGRHALLLLDAVSRGGPPGSVHMLLEPWRAPVPRPPGPAGAHGANASELLAAALLTGSLPASTVLVGLEPGRLSTAIGLSPAVREAMPRAATLAGRVLRRMLAGEVPSCTS